VTIARVPKRVHADVARKASEQLDQPAPFAGPHELADQDGIVFGTPTRRHQGWRQSTEIVHPGWADPAPQRPGPVAAPIRSHGT